MKLCAVFKVITYFRFGLDMASINFFLNPAHFRIFLWLLSSVITMLFHVGTGTTL